MTPNFPATEPSPSSPVDRRALVRDAIRISSLLGALVCATLTIAGLVWLAIGVGVGIVLGAVNFVLLARGVGGAIDRTVAGVERTQQEIGRRDASDGVEPNDVLGRPLGAGGPVRLGLSVLLVAGLLWFVPTDPAGLAMGIVITLFGGSVAALRHHAQANSRTPQKPV
jgi:hypothetical protein